MGYATLEVLQEVEEMPSGVVAETVSVGYMSPDVVADTVSVGYLSVEAEVSLEEGTYTELLRVSDAEIVAIDDGSMKVLLTVSTELGVSVG